MKSDKIGGEKWVLCDGNALSTEKNVMELTSNYSETKLSRF